MKFKKVWIKTHNVELCVEHSNYLQAYIEASLEEGRFLKQKAKIQWLKEGDGNTGYFHRVVQGK